jgi:hypothetical protein
MQRPQKITFGGMREFGVRGVLIYCSAATNGLMIGGWPILSRISSARLAASVALISGQIFTGMG